MIASVREGQDENDIKRVESLVKERIRKDSCLILLVVSCESMYYLFYASGGCTEI
jgi:hypothetical protein